MPRRGVGERDVGAGFHLFPFNGCSSLVSVIVHLNVLCIDMVEGKAPEYHYLMIKWAIFVRVVEKEIVSRLILKGMLIHRALQS